MAIQDKTARAMIQDSQCNKVYVSSLLQERCPVTFKGLASVLDRHEVKWSLLQDTKDIWCRDYMPIQISVDQFAGFLYDPDYLQSPLYKKTITDGNLLCRDLGMNVTSDLSKLRLDGGNIVKAKDCFIMTSKVFEENPQISVRELSETLENTLEGMLIILPWDTAEMFGHADGICRYAGNGTILMTNYSQFDPDMAYRFKRSLLPHFNHVKELKYNVKKPYKNNWAYINWLQTDNVLILPRFNVPEDEQAFEQIAKLMPEYHGRIEMVDSSDLVIHGGSLNCCTWTVFEK